MKFPVRCGVFIVLALLNVSLVTSGNAWTVERNFNRGPVGAKASGPDGFDSAQGRSVYSAVNVAEGDFSAQLTIRQGETGWGNWGGVIQHPDKLEAGDELWFRVRMWFPQGFDYFSYGEGNRLKVLRVHTADGSTGKHQGYNDILIDQKGSKSAFIFGFEGENRWRGIGAKSALPVFDRWETFELYMKFHPVAKASGGEAVIRFWKNGELLSEITDRKTLVSMNSVVTRSLLFTYWNGGAPKTQSMWVDDIVITSDTPRARDANGNRFIGMGRGLPPAPPAAPALRVGGK